MSIIDLPSVPIEAKAMTPNFVDSYNIVSVQSA